MKKIYHLSTCSTCQRIIKELQPLTDFELQDIKTEPITPSQLEQMHYIASGTLKSKIFQKKILKR